MNKEYKIKNSDEEFQEGALCYVEGSFFRVLKLENNLASIGKYMPHQKENVYFFTSSDEPNIHEPIKIYPHEYELELVPHEEYRHE